MAAPAQAPVTLKRGPSRALRLVRARLEDPSWQPNIQRSRDPVPPELPYEEFCPGALADQHCTQCSGGGIRTTLVRLKQEICPCVYRTIARRCASEYERIEAIPQPVPRRRRGGTTFDWPRHEWAADFCMIIRRTLTDRRERDIWVGMRLLRLPHAEVSRLVGVDRGKLFHALYRADQRIGVAVCWVKPYALWTPRIYCG